MTLYILISRRSSLSIEYIYDEIWVFVLVCNQYGLTFPLYQIRYQLYIRTSLLPRIYDGRYGPAQKVTTSCVRFAGNS